MPAHETNPVATALVGRARNYAIGTGGYIYAAVPHIVIRPTAKEMKGVVKFFQNGWGFITVDDDEEADAVFVHQADLLQEGFRKLRNKDRVEFELGTDDKGQVKAVQVSKIIE